MASSPPDIPGVAHRYVEIETTDAGRLRVHYAERLREPERSRA